MDTDIVGWQKPLQFCFLFPRVIAGRKVLLLLFGTVICFLCVSVVVSGRCFVRSWEEGIEGWNGVVLFSLYGLYLTTIGSI